MDYRFWYFRVGYFTTKQLQAMHRNLVHPSVESTMELIEKADVRLLAPGLMY